MFGLWVLAKGVVLWCCMYCVAVVDCIGLVACSLIAWLFTASGSGCLWLVVLILVVVYLFL